MGRKGAMGGGKSASSGRSGGLFGSRKPAAAPARQASTRSAPPPAAQPQAPPPAMPAQQPSGGGGLLSGIGSTIVQGMAFGTGSAIAHRAVDAVVGPRQVEHVHTGGDQANATAAAPAKNYGSAPAGPCGDDHQAFNKCVQENQGNVGACKFYYDVLQQCQQNEQANSQWK